MRPLYCEIRDGDLDFDPKHSNAGLWYDKFGSEWKIVPDKETGKEKWEFGKLDWIKQITRSENIGDADLIKQITDRQKTLLESFDSSPLFFQTIAPFATGLGRRHPVENGFAWHHTLGVPYLPGSSVKGMVRAFVEQWADDESEWQDNPKQKCSDIDRIFGPRDKPEHAIGSVTFLDALPINPVQLKPDVMTPHYSPYYQDSTGKTPPADWHLPIPISFLVVTSGNTFQFGLLPRRTKGKDREDCQRAAVWLKQALEWIGAGAKTAVGYGRFELDSDAEHKYQAKSEQRRQTAEMKRVEHEKKAALESELAGLSQIAKELEKEIRACGYRTDKTRFDRALEGLLTRLEGEPQADAAHKIEELVRYHYKGLLENPNKTEGKKNKPAFSERQKKIAQRLTILMRPSQ